MSAIHAEQFGDGTSAFKRRWRKEVGGIGPGQFIVSFFFLGGGAVERAN